jgi:TIR domain
VAVKGIMETLRKRYFSVWSDEEQLQAGMEWAKETERGLRDIVEHGGYLVTFISRASLESTFVRQELEFVAAKYPGQILPVLLEDVGPTLSDSSLATLHQIKLFQLDGRVDENRVDDLIIQIYYMVHKDSGGQQTAQ